MTKRALFAPLFASVFVLSLAVPAMAEPWAKPDDSIAYQLSAEDWTVTKTAHVTLNVEAAVSAANAGTVRADMIKTVNDAAKADWRLTAFDRSQDQTGLERWSVTFDTRLPEAQLNGLAEAVKKASKAGLQISVGSIDFIPTLDETEATRAALRSHIFKEANEQLASLNADLPGRSYRIAEISFDAAPQPMMNRQIMRPMMAVASAAPAENYAEPDHAQKVVLTAHVVFSALPPTTPASH